MSDILLNNELNVCVCCLSRKSPLINLTKCKHASFFSNLFENKVNFKDMCVCWLCHSVIKKIDSFKCQVEESCSKLKEINDKLVIRENNNLAISNIEINSTIDGGPIKFEVINNKPIIDQLETQKLITTVKVEHDSDSEVDSSVPLSRLKRRKKERKTDNHHKKDKGKIEGTKGKYDGKIRVVLLNWEQMMEERSIEASKKSYQNLPFKCESCITAFDHEETLKIHVDQRHTKREAGLECDVCKSVLGTERSYKEHTTRHIRRYECVACGKRNNNIHPVIKHYNEHHGSITTNFTCAECGFTTDSHSRYRYHRDKHKGKVACKECGGTFVNATVLRVHMFTVHGHSDRIYACNVCGKRYKAKSSLTSHQARHASLSPLTYCALCSNHYSSPLGLKHHLKTHSRHVRESDKRFICDECGTKFSSKRTLEEHIDWVHLMKIKYECDKCSKGFKNNSALRKHMNYVHEKKRPPRNKMCDHCGRGFTTLTILRSHVRTHTGERPLVCAQCEATFAHPAALYTHTKLLHGKS